MSSLFADLFRQRGWESRLKMHAIFLCWERVVGRDIARHARPHLVRGKVLWIGVRDSIWMQQLHLQKMMLLDKINGELGNDKLEDLRFQLDSKLDEEETGEDRRPKKQFRPLDAKRVEAFDKVVDGLADENLKRIVKKVWAGFEGIRNRDR